ncbi:hypothetical protein Poli38472_004641 [Pythium oligandrum]|uniref:Protochlorophyllide reductase n=1 Tax=Pythium oligandrum TaxID=41045 RepID=A0A8K1CAG9_PYTOL|nr:hypothetical protein Poli38472_004641 [Pythium oligandrum]|eukprot:TMW59572.1 hypothetical protein Poli38472_004641 [Pythium oligandrum]
MTATKKVFLVTGGNSGLGYQASLDLAKMENTHVIVTGRSAERVQAAVDKIKAEAASSSVVEGEVLDLGSLKAIQEYVTKFKGRGLTIDALMCNGGVQIMTKTPTVDGYESTFAINHLGHFYLTTLLRDVTRRVVIISSETHDPAEMATTPSPNVSDLEQLAHGYEKYEGNEAYTTSKLCNLLFMKEFVRRYPNGPEFIAYTPGFTPDTALLRNTGMDVAMIVKICEQNNIPISSTVVSGGVMARLCADDWAANGWTTDMYIRVSVPYEPSVQAKDPALARSLWEKSEELIARVIKA